MSKILALLLLAFLLPSCARDGSQSMGTSMLMTDKWNFTCTLSGNVFALSIVPMQHEATYEGEIVIVDATAYTITVKRPDTDAVTVWQMIYQMDFEGGAGAIAPRSFMIGTRSDSKFAIAFLQGYFQIGFAEFDVVKPAPKLPGIANLDQDMEAGQKLNLFNLNVLLASQFKEISGMLVYHPTIVEVRSIGDSWQVGVAFKRIDGTVRVFRFRREISGGEWELVPE
ncbi:MAG: hypothetical protein R3C59_05850 [Planctomycetaceae bacterium]